MRKRLLSWILAVCGAAALWGESGGPLLQAMRNGDMSTRRTAVEEGGDVRTSTGTRC
jgi:hypothetical protein